MKPPDRSVWDDFCKNPAPGNFEPLFETTKGLAYTICVRILRDRDDAQDAFQSTYCRLLAEADDLARIDDWEDLVCRLAVREANNLRKRRWRQRRKEIAMETPPVAADSSPRADEIFQRRQLRTQIEKIISSLPDRYRVPLLLHYFHGRSPAQIASATGVPVATIYSRISRGLKKLGPSFRAAGLSGGAAGLAALLGASDLLLPPSSLSAAVVFSKAREAAAIGGSVTSGVAASSLTTLLIGATMKAKVSVVVGIALVLLGAAAILRNEDPPAAEDTETTPTFTAAEKVSEEPAPVQARLQPAADPAPTALQGRVVLLGRATPVAGAEVTLRRSGNSVPVAAELRVETDAEGEFEFHDVAPGEYRLVARSDQNVSTVVACRFPPEAEETITLQLRRDRALTVRVRSAEDRSPIEGARVVVMTHRPRLEKLTDVEGIAKFSGLTPKEYLVEVTHAGRTRFRQSVDLASRAENVLQVVLLPGGSIHGVITDGTGQAVDTHLSYHFIGSSALKGELWGDDSAADGSYRIEYLPLGVKIGVSFGGTGFESVSRQVELTRDDPVREIDVKLTATLTGSIEGVVTDASKAPIERAMVTYGRPGPPKGDPHTYTAADGRFRLDDLPLGKKYVFLTFQAPGFGPKQIDAEPGSSEEPLRVAVALEKGHWIKGRVVDQDGEPIQGVSIQPYIDHNMIYQDLPQKTKTDSRGRFKLEGLPASLVFSFYASGYSTEYGWQHLELDRDDIEVEIRSTEAVISGRVVDEESRKPLPAFRVKLSASVEREPGDHKASGISTERKNVGVHFDSPDGTFELDGLTVGAPLFLTVEADGYPVQAFDRVMPESPSQAEPVEFLISKQGRSLRGTILLGTGDPVVGAKVLALVYRESERTDAMEVERNGIWSLLRNRAMRSIRLEERSLTTDERGRFSVTDLPDGHPVDLFIRSPAIAQTYVSRLEELSDAELDDLVVRVEAAASIQGEVNREIHAKVDRVILHSTDDPQFELHLSLAGDSTAFEFKELPSGRYRVLVVGPSEGLRTPLRILARSELHLGEGESAKIRPGSDAIFEIAGKISVRGKPLVAGVVILVSGNRDRWVKQSTTTDGEGRYAFLRVAPGSYDIAAFRGQEPDTAAVLGTPNRARVEVRDESLRRDFSFGGAGTVKGRIASFPPGFTRWRALNLHGSKELAGGGTAWRNIVLDADPSFSFGDLPPDTYSLEYRTVKGKKTLRERIVVSEGRLNVDLGDITIE